MSRVWRLPFAIGSGARLAYALGAVLVPERMDGRLAPRLHGRPDPRMNLRGFGGAQSGVAIYTLIAARTPQGARSALLLNTLVDGFDAMVSLLEWRDRGEVDQAVAGGLAFNLAGLTCWTIAAMLLRGGESD